MAFKKKVFPVFAFITMLLLLQWYSCKKDNLETLQNNGGGEATCDTSFSVSYVNDIVPILRFAGFKSPNTEPCYNCHTGATSGRGGGNRLDTYDFLKAKVDDGKLICVTNHGAGCPPMPDGGQKLSDCDIGRIEAWVNQGALNN